MSAGRGIKLPDAGAVFLPINSELGGVAVRSDGHVQLRSVGVGDHVLRPVMIEPARGEIDDFHRGRGDLRLTLDVREFHQPVGVRDVESVADEGHSERRSEPRKKNRADVGDAVAVGIPEKSDAVRARDRAAGAFREIVW